MKNGNVKSWLGVLAVLLSVNNYAADVRVNADLDHAKLRGDKINRAVVRIRVEPERINPESQRPPVNVAIVIDRSGSMQGAKLRHAKAGAIEALSLLNAEDYISVVSYSSEAHVVVPAQRARDIARIARKIEAISAGGGTGLYEGVQVGASELAKHRGNQYFHRLILLSDGKANNGPSSVGELRDLGGKLASDGISVSTIGVGLGFNEDLMTGLAETGEGNTYFVETSDDLPQILAAEIGDVMNVVAKNLVISISCQAGVTPLRLIGREGTISGQRAELRINQLYGGLNKDILLEVEVDGRKSSKVGEIVNVDVAYEDALDGSSQKRKAFAKASFSSDQSEVDASANPSVVRVVVDNQIAEAKEQAIQLMDAGKKNEAVLRMRQMQASVMGANKVLKDAYLEKKADVLKEEVRDLDDAGMSVTKRKMYRSESYQTKTQQKKTK